MHSAWLYIIGSDCSGHLAATMLRPASRSARRRSLTCTTPVYPRRPPVCLKSSSGLACSFRVHEHVCNNSTLATAAAQRPPPPPGGARHTPLSAASQLGVARHGSLLRLSEHGRALSSTSDHVGGDKDKGNREGEDTRTAAAAAEGGASLPEVKGMARREGEGKESPLEKVSLSCCLIVPTAVERRARNEALT